MNQTVKQNYITCLCHVVVRIGGKEKDMTREDIEKAALKGVEEYVNSGNLKGFRGSYL